MGFAYIRDLMEATKMYVKDYKLPIIPCESKKPLLKNWTTNSLSSVSEIRKYIDQNPNSTIGLVLGKRSGIIGVDIDGEEALNKYIELSGGELQDTWIFETPSGGMRLLFSIPEYVDLKKYTIPFSGQHNELAFLGDGQQTIMPPSVIQGVGSYKWVKGKSPDKCDLAMIPDFIQELMRKNIDLEVRQDEIPYYSDNNEVIGTLINKCKLFSSDYQVQQNEGLNEDRWFLWISLLSGLGQHEEALKFSKMSIKHNERSCERLKRLKDENKGGIVKCTTFGCSKEKIKQCHGCIKKKSNDPEDITNSPAWFIKNDKDKLLEEIGIFTDEHGNVGYINGNKFAQHILEKLTLLYTDEDIFYLYEEGLYKQLNSNDCSRIFRDILHQYVPDSWTISREVAYIEALKRTAPKVKQMNLDKNYINLNKGIFDLSSYKHISHSSKYLTTIRIPIDYDNTADCPRFKQFLSEVFEGDKERIAVIQEIMGYCLTSETKAQKAFLFYGQGSNGKSVLLKLITKLVGEENISSVPFNELNSSFARYDLLNKTVNIVTETEVEGKGFNSQYFKAIVAGDPIRVEIKGGASFPYSPICKILIGINNLFYSKDKSHAFTRRLLIVPFNKIFTSKNADKSLEEKLENELSGVFNFALEGLKRLRLNDYEFTYSSEIDNLLDDYKKSINPFESFVEENIEVADELSKISYGKISDLYTEWREDNGYANSAGISHNALAASLKKILSKKGILHDIAKSNGIRYITGIKIKEKETLSQEEKEQEDEWKIMLDNT